MPPRRPTNIPVSCDTSDSPNCIAPAMVWCHMRNTTAPCPAAHAVRRVPTACSDPTSNCSPRKCNCTPAAQHAFAFAPRTGDACPRQTPALRSHNNRPAPSSPSCWDHRRWRAQNREQYPHTGQTVRTDCPSSRAPVPDMWIAQWVAERCPPANSEPYDWPGLRSSVSSLCTYWAFRRSECVSFDREPRRQGLASAQRCVRSRHLDRRRAHRWYSDCSLSTASICAGMTVKFTIFDWM